jgi:hypothetical protein
MLSSLPKLADRAFILGTFLSTLLFAIALLLEFRDCHATAEWLAALTTKDNLGQTLYLILSVWALAVLLLMLNQPLYRLLEGYSFPNWLAEPLKERHRRHLKELQHEVQTLRDKWAKEESAFTELDRYRALRLERSKWMPSTERDVLPTRFGNAIKAFEVYPRDIYGADGVAIWLRLTAVIPKTFSEQIVDIKSQLDFLINSCLFSCIVAIVGAFRAAYSANWQEFYLSQFTEVVPLLLSIQKAWLVWAVGGVIAAYTFYRWAVSCVPGWGELVKTAFDCYLPTLATQLGFELPTTEKRRWHFWTTFSQQAIYGREPDGRSPFRLENWRKIPSGPKKAESGADHASPQAEGDHSTSQAEEGHNDNSEADDDSED